MKKKPKIKKIYIDEIKEAQNYIKKYEKELQHCFSKNLNYIFTSNEKSLMRRAYIKGVLYGLEKMGEYDDIIINYFKYKSNIKPKFIYKPSKMIKYKTTKGEKVTFKFAHISDKELNKTIKLFLKLLKKIKDKSKSNSLPKTKSKVLNKGG